MVVSRHFFCNNSVWDGTNAAPNASDDFAIAPDKTALLPGGTATFTNYTSYSRGLNGIILDILNLAGTVTNSDFTFKIGNSNTPGSWSNAPAPSSISVRTGDGTNGSDRVTILWPDNAIQKQWLEVTVLVTPATGLTNSDVFYFGNAIGESGNTNANAAVNATDEIGARNNPHTFLNPAPLDDLYDYNRDKRVNATDEIISRNNGTTFLNDLNLITVPAPGAPLVESEEPLFAEAVAEEAKAFSQGDSAQLPTTLAVTTTPTIVVGDHELLPNTPGQVIEIFVAGGTDVQGLNLNAQIADGGPEAGGSIEGPVITAVDLVGGTIFETNNTGAVDPGSLPQVAIRTITTADGTVPAEGLLATVTIDTTGLTNGTWTLALKETLNGATDFAGIPIEITDGTITIEAASGSDTLPPSVEVDSPTNGATAFGRYLMLSGSATDDSSVGSVIVSNSRGGMVTANLVGTNWLAENLLLWLGTNQVTIVASDTSTNVATDVITVVRVNTNYVNTTLHTTSVRLTLSDTLGEDSVTVAGLFNPTDIEFDPAIDGAEVIFGDYEATLPANSLTKFKYKGKGATNGLNALAFKWTKRAVNFGASSMSLTNPEPYLIALSLGTNDLGPDAISFGNDMDASGNFSWTYGSQLPSVDQFFLGKSSLTTNSFALSGYIHIEAKPDVRSNEVCFGIGSHEEMLPTNGWSHVGGNAYEYNRPVGHMGPLQTMQIDLDRGEWNASGSGADLSFLTNGTAVEILLDLGDFAAKYRAVLQQKGTKFQYK